MNTQSHSFDTILSLCPLRSGAFIVTVFGDVVLPGDGQMWIGHLIELCADLRISETLVRTSVSRLVTSGQLVGTRKGRRSFYALSPGARAEFDHAAQVIYTAPQERPWRFLFFPAGHSPDALQKVGDGRTFTATGLWPGARGRARRRACLYRPCRWRARRLGGNAGTCLSARGIGTGIPRFLHIGAGDCRPAQANPENRAASPAGSDPCLAPNRTERAPVARQSAARGIPRTHRAGCLRAQLSCTNGCRRTPRGRYFIYGFHSPRSKTACICRASRSAVHVRLTKAAQNAHYFSSFCDTFRIDWQ